MYTAPMGCYPAAQPLLAAIASLIRQPRPVAEIATLQQVAGYIVLSATPHLDGVTLARYLNESWRNADNEGRQGIAVVARLAGLEWFEPYQSPYPAWNGV